jgi:metallophosphoesterase superfamily enzyme
MVELSPGASAVAPGVLWLHASRALVAADVHLGYEDVIGAALPIWSTKELIGTLQRSAAAFDAREIILLGDVIHSSRMSEGAAREVQQGLAALRAATRLTLVAGNHEGKTRGAAILGQTVESAERDGWLLLHGDRAPSVAELSVARGAIIGHLHPSLPVGAGTSVPVFLAGERIVVVPALTPYSPGLNVFSDACLQALYPFNAGSRGDLHVVAAMAQLLYPFGTLSLLRGVMS